MTEILSALKMSNSGWNCKVTNTSLISLENLSWLVENLISRRFNIKPACKQLFGHTRKNTNSLLSRIHLNPENDISQDLKELIKLNEKSIW